MNQKTKLRPVIFSQDLTNKRTENHLQQVLLLKALQVTQDPKKLKQMIGVSTVAQVYRTLDKLAMRKEYHEALTRAGISFDYILGGIKNICDTSNNDSVKLKGFSTLLKSVGMEKYEDDIISGGGWEDILIKLSEKERIEREEKLLTDGDESQETNEKNEYESDELDYEVNFPEIPEDMKEKIRMDKEDAKSFYG